MLNCATIPALRNGTNPDFEIDMTDQTNSLELRVPLPANLKTAIVFHLDHGPAGWRARASANRPGFRWETSPAADHAGSPSGSFAMRLAAGELIDRLRRLTVPSRVRSRLIDHVRAFLDELPDELTSPLPVEAKLMEPSPPPETVPAAATTSSSGSNTIANTKIRLASYDNRKFWSSMLI